MKNVKNFKNKLATSGVKGLALDIDETLSWTIGHWVDELTKHFGNPENLTKREIIEKYRYTQNVPYWQSGEALEHVRKHRYSNETQVKLPLIKDANHIVNKIHLVTPIVAYITIRPETVIPGTEQWLAKHGFPIAPVIARPGAIDHKDGNAWKAGVLSELYPEVLGIVDDNPQLVDELPEGYQGVIYLYDNLNHHRKDLDVRPCPKWEDVAREILE